MSDEQTRKLILARRAAFIAAAVAGIASCDPKPSYKDVCLQPQGGPTGYPPGSYVDPPGATSADPNADAGSPPAPPPAVCLSPLPASKP